MPILFGLMLGMLLGAIDGTIVSTALPTIGRALHDEINLPWVVTAYLLASIAVTPLYGKLSDIHGRRAIMVFAIGLFILGSIACALAPNLLALVLARGLQGAGGGGLISLAQTIIADIVSPRERGRYQVYIASVFATSSLAGPALGGFLLRTSALDGDLLDQRAAWPAGACSSSTGASPAYRCRTASTGWISSAPPCSSSHRPPCFCR